VANRPGENGSIKAGVFPVAISSAMHLPEIGVA
jgi:hypothetical protein